MIQPHDEDDESFDFEGVFGYNEKHPVRNLRKSIINPDD